jgi:hypothetical protein
MQDWQFWAMIAIIAGLTTAVLLLSLRVVVLRETLRIYKKRAGEDEEFTGENIKPVATEHWKNSCL